MARSEYRWGTVVVLPDDVLRTLIRSGTVAPSDVIGTTTSELADGSHMKGLQLRLRQLRIGNRTVHDVVASVSPGNGEPLLGQSFLMKFGSVTIDNQRRVLVLSDGAPGYIQPPAAASPTLPITQQPVIGGAAGYGAIAYDQMTGRYGVSSNEPNAERASELALRNCGSTQCQVHPVEPHGCGALAKSDTDKAWGGADRNTLEDAKRDAIAHCQTHTSTGHCVVVVASCNS